MAMEHEPDIRKFLWETSRRAKRSGRITDDQLQHALDLHVRGRYEDAIAEIRRIPEAERSAEAFRILGHAEHGRENFQQALSAHRKARDLHASDPAAAAEDEVNLAAVFISMRTYDEAWEATDRALQLDPEGLTPWIPRIAILNRQARTDELEALIRYITTNKPDILEDTTVLDHLNSDTDFVGVREMIETCRVEDSK